MLSIRKSFIIYAARMMGKYRRNLTQNKECGSQTKIKKKTYWANLIGRNTNISNTNPHTGIPQPIFEHTKNTTTTSDALKFSDDTATIVNNSSYLYPKLQAFDKATGEFRLPINWGKVTVLVRKHNSEIMGIKRTMPIEYRNLKFAKTTTLLGNKYR